MGKFEDHIKQAAEQYKVDYNPDHWKRIEKNLASPKKNNNWKLVAGLALLAISATYFLLPQSETLPTESKKEQNTAPVAPATEKTTNQKPTSTQQEPVATTPIAKEKAVIENTPTQEIAQPVEPKTTVEEDALVLDKNTPKESGLNFTFVADRNEACIKDPVRFTAEISEPVNYRWSFGDGTESTLPQPIHTYKKDGLYSVSLEVTSIISGESKRVLEGGMIKVNPAPFADFQYNFEAPKDFQQKIKFDVNQANYTQVEWIIDGKNYTEKQLELPFNKKGNYPITLIAKNSFGCYDTTTQFVAVENSYNLLAPNAFTPDNDGLNDIFLPKALGEQTNFRYDLNIVDVKTGQTIFSTNQDGNGWNGTDITTGGKAEQGNYAWKVKIYKPSGEIEKFQGIIQLLEL